MSCWPALSVALPGGRGCAMTQGCVMEPLCCGTGGDAEAAEAGREEQPGGRAGGGHHPAPPPLALLHRAARGVVGDGARARPPGGGSEPHRCVPMNTGSDESTAPCLLQQPLQSSRVLRARGHQEEVQNLTCALLLFFPTTHPRLISTGTSLVGTPRVLCQRDEM